MHIPHARLGNARLSDAFLLIGPLAENLKNSEFGQLVSLNENG
jgi:hypothetical protein